MLLLLPRLLQLLRPPCCCRVPVARAMPAAAASRIHSAADDRLTAGGGAMLRRRRWVARWRRATLLQPRDAVYSCPYPCAANPILSPSLAHIPRQLQNKNARRVRNAVFNEHYSDMCSSAGWLEVYKCDYAMPRLAASLRGAFALFFALANAPTDCECNASESDELCRSAIDDSSVDDIRT